MTTELHIPEGTDSPLHKFVEGLSVTSGEILGLASRGVPRDEFLNRITSMVLELCTCDAVEVRLREGSRRFRCEAKRNDPNEFRFENILNQNEKEGEKGAVHRYSLGITELCELIESGTIESYGDPFTSKGSLWVGDTQKKLTVLLSGGKERIEICFRDDYASLALIPFKFSEDISGVLQLKSKQLNYFTKEQTEFFEVFAQTLAIAIAHRKSNVLLRERVKELVCLYGIAQAAAQPNVSLDEILQKIVELLPPAFMYPEITSAVIRMDGRMYTTPTYREGVDTLAADIVIGGKCRGKVEVTYFEKRPRIDEGPFLREERNLIETIAQEVAVVAERKHIEEEKVQLIDQLRHADRLATVGQLAAGVAHELNEPLAAMLGYAQLVLKNEGMPPQARQDIERIVTASLHSREIVKKLLLFARQMPPQKRAVNMNQVVDESLYFLSSRCAKEGIRLVFEPAHDLPDVIADPSQLQQLIVNLVVNALQAMPHGGRLTIQTAADEANIVLIVEDTGVGMTKDVLKQIFTPFFTTKPVGQGTGLGLAVVHGIVTSHGGLIRAESAVSKGTRFEIRLPIARKKPEGEENHG